MEFDVKITTSRMLAELLCPHYCTLCGRVGGLLCDCCKNHITADHINQCLKCGLTIRDHCPNCTDLPFSCQWTFGHRSESIGQMINLYKFQSVRAFAAVFADLLSKILPEYYQRMSIVCVPTIQQHIRARGFDHTELIARHLARIRHWRVEKLLGRAKNTIQVGADRDQRLAQAAAAYQIIKAPDPNTPYLILDDVWTTGASLCAAAELLKQNGAQSPMVAILARSGAA